MSILEIILALVLLTVGLKYFKISPYIFLACFSLWLISYYFTFPAAVSDLSTDYIAVSKLDNDKFDLKLRHWKLNKKLINKKFTSKAEASTWLESRENAVALVSGDNQWLDLFFRDNYKSLEKLIGKIDNLEINQLIVKDQKTNLKFIFLPKEVKVPFSPFELSSALIRNIVNSLEQRSIESTDQEINKRLNAVKKARSVYGHWKSGMPRSLAFFLEANFLLLDLMRTEDLSSCKQVHKIYQAAASLAKQKNGASSQFSALIYNNAAVAKKRCGVESKKLFDLALETSSAKALKEIITANKSL